MKIKNRVLIIILFVCLLASCASYDTSPKVSHAVTQITQEKINMIWVKESVYTVWSTFDSTIDASNNRICFLGGLDVSIDNDVVCLNSLNGDILWQKYSGVHSSIALTPNAVFVIYNNIVGARRYDSSGEIVWSKNLGGTGSNYLYVVDEQLQILTIPERLWILDFDGNEIRKVSDQKIFVSTSDETFVKLNGIQLQKTDTEEVVWQYNQFDDILEMAPLLTDSKIFVRTGQETGSVFSLDRKTGALIWKTGDSIVSNVAYSPSKGIIYALAHTGELLAIKESNGKADTIAKFSSVPFALNGEANVGNYQLAYDLNAHILFVSLGDSRQLFAFKEQ